MNALRLVLFAAGVSASPGEFVYVSNCYGFSCAWFIAVSEDGLVTVELPATPHAGRRYRLTPRAFASFRAAVMRERPSDLSGLALGDLVVDGPDRTVRVTDHGKTASIRVHATPPGYAKLYRTDASSLARALRICEATRELGGSDLAGCVEDR